MKHLLFIALLFSFTKTFTQYCHIAFEGNLPLHEECICSDNSNSYEFRIRFYVLQDDDSSNGINESILGNILGEINNAFTGSNISFVENECGIIHINNTALNSGWTLNNGFDDFLEALSIENSDPTCLNIYLANQNHAIKSGFAYFMNNMAFLTGQNSVYPDKQAHYLESNTYVHEIGHLLGLYHTHESQFGPECFNKNLSGDCSSWDCILTGDLICDTERDFNISTNAVITDLNSCQYLINDNIISPFPTFCMDETDLNFLDLPDLWEEALENSTYSTRYNFMSYSHPDCQSEFTPQQMTCMRNRIANSSTIQRALTSNSETRYSCECILSQNLNSQSTDLIFDGDVLFNDESFRVDDDSDLFINGTLTLENGSFLHLGTNAKIIVNGTLSINNSYLVECCDLWTGIQVNLGGRVEIRNGSILSGAYTMIENYGGSISIKDSEFSHFYNGIYLYNSSEIDDFSGNKFIGATEDLIYNNINYGSQSQYGIGLSWVNNIVEIGGIVQNEFENLKTAIHSFNSKVHIRNNKIKGCDRGVERRYSGGSIANNVFENNKSGSIYTYREGGKSSIVGNDFQSSLETISGAEISN